MKSEPSRTCTIGAWVEKLNHASLTTKGAKQVPGSQKNWQTASFVASQHRGRRGALYFNFRLEINFGLYEHSRIATTIGLLPRESHVTSILDTRPETREPKDVA